MRSRSALLAGAAALGLVAVSPARATVMLSASPGSGSLTLSGDQDFYGVDSRGYPIAGNASTPVTEAASPTASFTFVPSTGDQAALPQTTVDFLSASGSTVLAALSYNVDAGGGFLHGQYTDFAASSSAMDLSPPSSGAELVAFGSGFSDAAYGLNVDVTEPDPDPVAVAEPGSLLVLASGLIGLGVISRRRRRSASPEA